jgi:hypothetical protein
MFKEMGIFCLWILALGLSAGISLFIIISLMKLAL